MPCPVPASVPRSETRAREWAFPHTPAVLGARQDHESPPETTIRPDPVSRNEAPVACTRTRGASALCGSAQNHAARPRGGRVSDRDTETSGENPTRDQNSLKTESLASNSPGWPVSCFVEGVRPRLIPHGRRSMIVRHTPGRSGDPQWDSWRCWWPCSSPSRARPRRSRSATSSTGYCATRSRQRPDDAAARVIITLAPGARKGLLAKLRAYGIQVSHDFTDHRGRVRAVAGEADQADWSWTRTSPAISYDDDVAAVRHLNRRHGNGPEFALLAADDPRPGDRLEGDQAGDRLRRRGDHRLHRRLRTRDATGRESPAARGRRVPGRNGDEERQVASPTARRR